MNLTWTKASVIITLIILVGGTAFGIERYFAKQSEHEKLAVTVAKADKKYACIEDVLAMNKRITKNSLEDVIYKTQQRLWLFEDRYAKTQDVTLLRIIEELKEKIKVFKQKLYNLETN